MATTCFNRISCDNVDDTNRLKSLLVDANGNVTFSIVVPMPEDIENSDSSQQYHWMIENWGVKYNAYDSVDNTAEYDCLDFFTPYAPPVAFYYKLAQKIDFWARSINPEEGLAGNYEGTDGDLDISEYDREDDFEGFMEIAEQFGHEPEEFEDDEHSETIEDLTTPEGCLAAVQNGTPLEDVPEALRTFEVCQAAVQDSGWQLRDVPDKLKTLELYSIAVQNNGYALMYVLESLKTPDLCLLAVQATGAALEYVPDELKTSDLCHAAVKSSSSALQYVPEKLKTLEFCLAAVQQDGCALEFVPIELRSVELCRTAVESNSYALRYIPEKLCTVKLCLTAVQQTGSVLDFIPKELITAELCIAAVQSDGSALEYVPEEFKTIELCRIAVQNNDWALQFVPNRIKKQLALIDADASAPAEAKKAKKPSATAIKITGKKVLRTIRREFQARFPYLGLSFQNPDQWKIAQEKGGTIFLLDDGKKLAEVRTVPPPKDEKEISVHGSVLAKNLKSTFLKTYGLYVQVTFQKGDTVYYTNAAMDAMNLTQLNKKMEEDGCVKKPGNASKA